MPCLWGKCKQTNASNPMQLMLRQHHLNELLSYAQKNPTFESCAYLLGTSDDKNNQLKQIIPMSNVHPSAEHFFAFSPNEQLRVFHLLQKLRLQIIGIFHSHPHSPPILSDEDLKYIFFPNQSNLILSLKNGPLFASYRLISDQIKEERIRIL